jgi:hypothetical protein
VAEIRKIEVQRFFGRFVNEKLGSNRELVRAGLKAFISEIIKENVRIYDVYYDGNATNPHVHAGGVSRPGACGEL